MTLDDTSCRSFSLEKHPKGVFSISYSLILKKEWVSVDTFSGMKHLIQYLKGVDLYYLIGMMGLTKDTFMKKLLLSVCACLMGLSAQAAQDWRTEPNAELAREHFQNAKKEITREDIRDVMRLFPGFLEWKFFGRARATIVHVVGFNDCSQDVLYYLLGFSPSLGVQDYEGRTPEEMCRNPELKKVFDDYKRNPWRHPNEVLELPVDHERYSYDRKRFGEREDLIGRNEFEDGQQKSSSKPSFLNSVFDRKVLGGLGTMVLLGLIYRYYGNKDKKHIAAAA